MAPADFADALMEGLAPDGGLVVPEEIPVLTAAELDGLAGAAYPQVAAAVLSRFVGDGVTGLDEAAIAEVTRTAYGPDRFDHPDVVSLRSLDEGLVLYGLSHGPTLAFKDMALQLIAGL
ncbi:MAG: threonine synthase, partial [Actinomycetota bacterium]|nr:threonine synthase [Actinomycetota bacterium]